MVKMLFISTIKKTNFAKTFNLLKKNLDNAFLIFIIDVWFVVAILLYISLVKYISVALQYYPTAILIMFTAVYYIFMLLIYSFFKYCVLHYLKSMFEKTKFSFNRLLGFFLLNAIMVVCLLAVFIGLNAFLLNIKAQYRTVAVILVMALFGLFSYAIVNTAHTLFSNISGIGKVLAKSLKITFLGIKAYLGIYLSSAIILAAYFLLYYAFEASVRKTGIAYSSAYLNVFIAVTSIILYAVVFFNRVYFYLIIKRNL